MKVQAINNQSVFVTNQKQKKQSPNFKAELAMTKSLQKEIANNTYLASIMDKFGDWVSTQRPYDKILTATMKKGKCVSVMSGYDRMKRGGQPLPIERQEDLEFTMGGAKSGFCVNYEESSDRILNDLKYMYDCIKSKL